VTPTGVTETPAVSVEFVQGLVDNLLSTAASWNDGDASDDVAHESAREFITAYENLQAHQPSAGPVPTLTWVIAFQNCYGVAIDILAAIAGAESLKQEIPDAIQSCERDRHLLDASPTPGGAE
jgi:hypothetical protein